MIKAKGVYAYKTSDRYQSGVPDIYVSGGNWIESKSAGIKKAFNWHAAHSQEQINMSANLRKSGDKVLCASVWTIHNRVYFIIVPWVVISHKPVWDRVDIKEWGFPYSKIENWMDMFDSKYHRNFDTDWEKTEIERWQ